MYLFYDDLLVDPANQVKLVCEFLGASNLGSVDQHDYRKRVNASVDDAQMPNELFIALKSYYKDQIEQQNNIALMTNTEVSGYDGQEFVENIEVAVKEKGRQNLAVNGIFLAIGWRPNISALKLEVQKTAEGYLETNDKLMTSVPGLFAAGDVRDTDMWQVLTACADGARAAKYAAEYLEKLTRR